MKKPKILIFGDANIDLIIRDLKEIPKMGQEIFVNDMEVCVGGSATNVAVGLAKLGIDTYIYTMLSNDIFGKYIIDYFEKVNLSTKYIKIADVYKSGVSIGITNKKDRSFISYMGTNGEFSPSNFDLKKLAEFTHIHFSVYNFERCLKPYLAIVKHCKSYGCTTSLDLGWTDLGENRQDLIELLQYIDVFFPNTHEGKYLCGTDDINIMLEELSKHVKDVVVITSGENGAYAYKSQKIYHRAFKVEAIDSIGSGDAFDAGFLSGYINGEDIQKCVDYGCACGAMVACSIGGSISSPKKDEMHRFLEQNT